MVDAQSGTYMTGSGLGKSITTRELTLMNNDNIDEVKFNQSSIGTSTKKALESATAKVVKRMIQKQIFTN
jgi:ABC-type oligopeptide transport system ATPase subunit